MSLSESSNSTPNPSPREENNTAKSALENMSKEELIKQMGRFRTLLQKSKNKCDEMKEKCTNLESEMTRVKETAEKHQETLKDEINRGIKNYNNAKEEIECMQLKENTMRATVQTLQEEISSLTNENKNLRCNAAEIEILKNENLKLEQGNAGLTKEIEKIKTLITEKEQESNLMHLKMEELKKLVEAERQQKTLDVEELVADKLRLENKIKSLIQEKNTLKDSLEDLSDNQTNPEDMDQVLMQLEQSQDENMLLRSELENVTTERDRLLFQEKREDDSSVLDQIQKLESELEDCRNKLEGAEFEVEELKAKLEDVNENGEMKVAFEGLKRRENLFLEFFNELLDSNFDRNGIETSLNLIKSRFNDLQSEVEKLSFELNDKNVEILEMREKLTSDLSLMEINEHLKHDLHLLKNEFNKLKQMDLKHDEEHLLAYERQMKELKSQIDAKNVEILEMREKSTSVLSLMEVNEQLKHDLYLLKNEFNKLKQMDLKHEEHLFAYERQMNELKSQIDAKNKLIEESQHKIEIRETEYQATIEEKNKLQEELKYSKQNFESSKSELERQVDAVKRELELRSNISSTDDVETLQLKSKIQEMTEVIDSLRPSQDECNELQNLVSNLKALVEEGEQRVQQLEDYNKVLIEENSKLKKELEHQFSKEGELEDMKRNFELRCTDASETEIRLTSEAEEMKKELIDLRSRVNELLKERNSFLQRPNLDEFNRLKEVNSRNAEQIDVYEKEIKDLQFQYGESKLTCEQSEQKIQEIGSKYQELIDKHSKLKHDLGTEKTFFEKEKLELLKKFEDLKRDLELKRGEFSENEAVANSEIEEMKNEVVELRNKIKELSAEKMFLLERPTVEEFKEVLESHQIVIEKEKKLTESYKVEVDKKLLDLANANAQLVALKAEKDLHQSEITASKNTISELNAKITVLIFEKENGRVKQEELASEIKRLNDSVSAITKQLEQEKEGHGKTTSQFETLQMQMKQQKLMNLELADYERLVTELNEKMEKSNDEKETLKHEIKQQHEMVTGLKVQVEQIETQRKQSEDRSNKMKLLLVKTKKEFAELRKKDAERNKVDTQLKTEIEMFKQKIESMQVEMSETVGTNEKLQEALTTTKESHQRVVKSLESRIVALQADLKTTQQEFAECKTEFESYKVRVHSVLKQQKNKSPSAAQKDLDACERECLEKVVDQLKLKLEEATEQMNALKAENATLQDEHERSLNRFDRVVNELRNKEQEFNEKLEIVRSEETTLKQGQAQALQLLRRENEAIVDTYKEQIKTLKEESERIISDLRVKLTTAELEVSRSQQKGNGRDEADVFDVASMERQEGEGSENTERNSNTPPVRYNYDNMSTELSLEQLLNSKNSGMDIQPSHEEQDGLEQRLFSCSKKIDHLTELLNESEATNMRLTEQTRVLKEEIRRLERNQERQEHTANMEYLKNVVFKFLTLTGGDERERLVPVLHMMLKLSPQEKNDLLVIAKGTNPEAEGDNVGWANYLPRWSGLV